MKARLPRSWDRLPPSEKKIIAEVKEQEINQYFAKLQKNWLMLSCIVEHDYCGRSAEECLLYLANFKEVYRLNSKFATEEEQMAWLNGKMDEIFGKGNYPYEYIDKLEEM
jgi:hypothetical protein